MWIPTVIFSIETFPSSANPQSTVLKDIVTMEQSKSAGEDRLRTLHATDFTSDIY
jgi:hypothetical protein